MSRFGPKEFRARISRVALRLSNIARRVVISSSSGGSWGFEGYSIPDLRGGSSVTTEGADYEEAIEVFAGVGIYARPADGDNAEAVILEIGAEADHPTIIAVRNEAARARYAEEFGEVQAGEVAIFNSVGTARAIIKADGSIELNPAAGQEVLIRSAGGTAEALATLADVEAVQSALNGHTHTYIPGTATPVLTTLNPAVPAPSGTSVVKGE